MSMRARTMLHARAQAFPECTYTQEISGACTGEQACVHAHQRTSCVQEYKRSLLYTQARALLRACTREIPARKHTRDVVYARTHKSSLVQISCLHAHKICTSEPQHYTSGQNSAHVGARLSLLGPRKLLLETPSQVYLGSRTAV